MRRTWLNNSGLGYLLFTLLGLSSEEVDGSLGSGNGGI